MFRSLSYDVCFVDIFWKMAFVGTMGWMGTQIRKMNLGKRLPD